MTKIIDQYFTYTFRLSKSSQPCEPNSDYSFTQCVKDFVAQTIGCRMMFGTNDTFTSIGKFGNGPRKLNECSKLDEAHKYENMFFRIYQDNKKKFLKRTGCQFPCNYMEYEVVDRQNLKKGFDAFRMKFASDEIDVEIETYIYDWISFIAECNLQPLSQ